MRYRYAFFVLFVLNLSVLQAQQQWTSSELHHQIQKLNFLGSALYVAAHPDDENQRVISYMGNEVKARTAYLSITRGDGGQNLIGPELRESLGVLRTQELLAAREKDGGEQRFTRAVDFGYSKHPDETLAIWDKELVLGDVIWAIRKFRPDIIINRFDHRSPGSTHGHHTSSAMLSFDAFDKSNDPNSYPNQLTSVDPWQPKRLFFNTSWWFYGSQENFDKADKTNLAAMDVGVYYPELGLSNNEIAAMARSQHKCQGFGQMTNRGSTTEYVEFLKGEPLTDKSNLFAGINTTWSRVKGGEAIGKLLKSIEDNFNFADPSVHVPDFMQAYTLLQQIEDEHWRALKSNHLRQIIMAASGLYLQVNSGVSSATPGETISLSIEAVNRSDNAFILESVVVNDQLAELTPNKTLGNNQKEELQLELAIPKNMAYSTPYWLNSKGSLGVYAVENETLIGLPETPPSFEVKFKLKLGNRSIEFTSPVQHRFSRPDQGEQVEPFVILPQITTSFNDPVFIFSDASAKRIAVNLRAGKDAVDGEVRLKAPEGWTITPESQPIRLDKKEEVTTVFFELTPPEKETVGLLNIQVTLGDKTFDRSLVEIAYDHIPKQSVLFPAEAKIVRLNIEKRGNLVGYIVGAGDAVPESLQQIGYQVETINVGNLQPEDLEKFDAIVMGIRAYNVIEELKFKQPILLDYVKNGGTLIVQYNTAGRWAAQFENIAPYPMTISRDRVTNENSTVEIIAKNHPLINEPNPITLSDFKGWVQERGLYFPNKWSEEFTPILAMNDDGEGPMKGSLLVASYGKGHYIYTGLSFFRELPVGVPGAYKLFANMLSLGKLGTETSTNARGKR